MSYKPDESTLLSYLYDELSVEEKRKVEQYLGANEDAQAELAELRDAQSILEKIRDRDVAIPTFSFEDSKVVSIGSTPKWWKNSLAIAASISLILLAGHLSQINFSVGEGGVSLGFGEQRTQTGYSNSQVEDMIQKAIVINSETFLQQLRSSEKEMKRMISDEAEKNKKELNSYLVQQKNQSIEVLRGLMEQSELAQRNYTNDVLQEFAIFLETQRQDDMNVIQARFDNLMDGTQLNRMQTNQLISNLYSDENQTQNQY